MLTLLKQAQMIKMMLPLAEQRHYLEISKRMLLSVLPVEHWHQYLEKQNKTKKAHF